MLPICRDIKLLVHIAVLRFVDGPSRSFEVEEVATSTHFMELRVIGNGNFTYYLFMSLRLLCFAYES